MAPPPRPCFLSLGPTLSSHCAGGKTVQGAAGLGLGPLVGQWVLPAPTDPIPGTIRASLARVGYGGSRLCLGQDSGLELPPQGWVYPSVKWVVTEVGGQGHTAWGGGVKPAPGTGSCSSDFWGQRDGRASPAGGCSGDTLTCSSSSGDTTTKTPYLGPQPLPPNPRLGGGGAGSTEAPVPAVCEEGIDQRGSSICLEWHSAVTSFPGASRDPPEGHPQTPEATPHGLCCEACVPDPERVKSFHSYSNLHLSLSLLSVSPYLSLFVSVCLSLSFSLSLSLALHVSISLSLLQTQEQVNLTPRPP